MSFAKPQVLFLAIKHPKGGKGLQPMMDNILKSVREEHGERIGFDGLLLDDDKSHDDQLRNILEKTKFDVISFGGGIRLTSAQWADRVEGIINGSQSKDAKVMKPQSPQEGVDLAIEAAKNVEK